MIRISKFLLVTLLAAVPIASAQNALQLEISTEQPTTIRAQDMEVVTLAALRKEFPRLSGVFASAHSCRLPDYGPFISVTIQLPSYYFTRPILQELDRRSRAAEEEARKVKDQLERASQMISLRSKEAGLMQKIEWEESSKTKSKDTLEDLQNQLTEVRKNLDSLESEQPQVVVVQESMTLSDVDLNKMLAANYQQLIQRVTNAMRNSLAENAPKIADLKNSERVGINTFIRDNILGSPGKSILFILNHKDIEEFKSGKIDLDALRQRVIVQDDTQQ
jgi:hypothetical protein